MPLLRTTALIRLVALPACLLYGLVELCALQRARWQRRRLGH